MKQTLSFLIVLFAFAGVLRADESTGLDPNALLAEINSHVDFPHSTATMEMVVLRDERPQRSYVMRVLKRDTEEMRIEFLEPKREKDRKLLRVGDKMWMYLPDLRKSIVLSARQSFLGSSLSNADLLRTDLVADYRPELVAEETRDERPVVVLDLHAKERTVAYDRIRLWAWGDTMIPIKEELYTRSGKLLKTIEFSEQAQFGGAVLASRLRVTSALRKSETTELTYTGLERADELPIALFRNDSLGRSR